MTTPKDDQVEAHVGDNERTPGSAGVRRRRATTAGGLAILLVAGVVVAAVAVGRSSTSAPAAPAATTSPQTGKVAPVSAPVPAAGPAVSTDPRTGKVIPPAMSIEQYDKTRTELTALAARLPAHLTLTAPATWAQYAGQEPTYDEDIVSCPHIADRLAADLGARWTYSFGKLPTGPFGCNWTPVPWVPDVSRFFVSIGYQTGTVPGLMQGMDYCAGGVEAPRVDVPAVGRGAVLYGCDDVNGPSYDLAIPDAGGSGVFFLHAKSDAQQSPSEVADAFLAVIDGAARAYS
jgi:hypothetical protein